MLSRRKKQESARESRVSRGGGRDAPDYDGGLFEALRALRRRIASEKRVPPYVVFGDATLQQMAHYIPQSEDSLSRISGVGTVKLGQYGDDFLAVIREYAREKDLTDRTAGLQLRSKSRSTRTASYTIRARLLNRQGSCWHKDYRLMKWRIAERDIAKSTIMGTYRPASSDRGEAIDLRALFAVSGPRDAYPRRFSQNRSPID